MRDNDVMTSSVQKELGGYSRARLEDAVELLHRSMGWITEDPPFVVVPSDPMVAGHRAESTPTEPLDVGPARAATPEGRLHAGNSDIKLQELRSTKAVELPANRGDEAGLKGLVDAENTGVADGPTSSHHPGVSRSGTNYSDSRGDLDELVAGRTPIIVLRTSEKARAMRLVKDVATSTVRLNLPFWIYTREGGLRDLRSNRSVTDDRSLNGALDFAASQFTSRPQANVVFVDPGDLHNDSDLTRYLDELSRLAEANSGCVVLITDMPVWAQLQHQGMSIILKLPQADEMYELVVSTLHDQSRVVTIEWTEQDARLAAEFLVGLSEIEAVNLLTKIIVAKVIAREPVTREDVFQLPAYKDRFFGDLAGLERVQLKTDRWAIGGLTNLRSWLRHKHQLMNRDLRGTGLRPPRSILLVGVPGSGKSLSARVIAAEWSLPLYRLDFTTIMDQSVGQSEVRLRDTLETADRISPCVLWIDEIENGLADQNDSTGIGRRLVGQFLFWLHESTSRVFLVATANDVRSLPPELLRKGHFDEIFFIDLPNTTDRAEIIRLYYSRYMKLEVAAELLAELVTASDGFTGSEIEFVLRDVGGEVLLNGGVDELRPELVLEAFTNTVPFSRTNPEQVEEIRAWSRERALPAGTSRMAETLRDANWS